MTSSDIIIEYQKFVNSPITGKFDLETIKATAIYYGLNAKEMSYVLGQAYVETGGFMAFSEKTTWSAATMKRIFSGRFKPERQIKVKADPKYTYDTLGPKSGEVKANFIYAGINGNGDVASGDGWNYRGRGAIQLTGKSNYQAFADFLQDQTIMTDPDQVSGKHIISSAIFYFHNRGLFKIVNSGAVVFSNIDKVTYRVNAARLEGGLRASKTIEYYKILQNVIPSNPIVKTTGTVVSLDTNQPVNDITIEVIESPPTSLPILQPTLLTETESNPFGIIIPGDTNPFNI